MKRALGMLKLDARQALRDPMLGFMLLAPALLFPLLHAGLPAAERWLAQRYAFDWTAFEPLVLATAVLIMPLLFGSLAGFVMLEERDERLIACLAVTPLGKRGYALCRLLPPCAATVGLSAALLYGGGIAPPAPAYAWPAIALTALQTPLVALAIAAFAANRVEALAVAKALGLIVCLPAAAYFLPWPPQLALGIAPPYWSSALIVRGSMAESGAAAAMTLAGLCSSAGALLALYKVYMRKAE